MRVHFSGILSNRLHLGIVHPAPSSSSIDLLVRSRLPVRRILSCYAPPIQQRKERLQVSLYSATRYDTSSKTLAYGIDLSGTAMYRSRRITPSNFNSIQIPICSKWTRIKDGHDGMDVQNIPYPQDIAEPHAKS